MQSSSNRLRVDFQQNYHDMVVREFIHSGLGVRAIMEETGLTEAQVRYRIACLGFSLLDFRRGDNPESRMMINHILARLSKLGRQIRKMRKAV